LVVYNISIFGLTKRLGISGIGVGVRVVVIALAVLCIVAWLRRPRRSGDFAALGAFALVTTLLASALSEDHYLLVVLPCVILAAALRRLQDLLLLIPGAVVLAVPRSHFGAVGNSAASLQVRYFLAQLLLAAATAILVVRAPSTAADAPYETVPLPEPR
jgi:hypothetical protein